MLPETNWKLGGYRAKLGTLNQLLSWGTEQYIAGWGVDLDRQVNDISHLQQFLPSVSPSFLCLSEILCPPNSF